MAGGQATLPDIEWEVTGLTRATCKTAAYYESPPLTDSKGRTYKVVLNWPARGSRDRFGARRDVHINIERVYDQAERDAGIRYAIDLRYKQTGIQERSEGRGEVRLQWVDFYGVDYSWDEETSSGLDGCGFEGHVYTEDTEYRVTRTPIIKFWIDEERFRLQDFVDEEELAQRRDYEERMGSRFVYTADYLVDDYIREHGLRKFRKELRMRIAERSGQVAEAEAPAPPPDVVWEVTGLTPETCKVAGCYESPPFDAKGGKFIAKVFWPAWKNPEKDAKLGGMAIVLKRVEDDSETAAGTRYATECTYEQTGIETRCVNSTVHMGHPADDIKWETLKWNDNHRQSGGVLGWFATHDDRSYDNIEYRVTEAPIFKFWINEERYQHRDFMDEKEEQKARTYHEESYTTRPFDPNECARSFARSGLREFRKELQMRIAERGGQAPEATDAVVVGAPPAPSPAEDDSGEEDPPAEEDSPPASSAARKRSRSDASDDGFYCVVDGKNRTVERIPKIKLQHNRKMPGKCVHYVIGEKLTESKKGKVLKKHNSGKPGVNGTGRCCHHIGVNWKDVEKACIAVKKSRN